MARRCSLTGKAGMVGNRVSHSNRRTKHRQLANIQKKTFFVPELKRSVTLRLSTRAIRTIDKLGFAAYIKKLGIKKLSAL